MVVLPELTAKRGREGERTGEDGRGRATDYAQCTATPEQSDVPLTGRELEAQAGVQTSETAPPQDF